MAKGSTLSYAALQEQIAKLQSQAEEVRRTEVTKVISQIKVAIKHYGLSAADLGFGGKGAATAPPAVKRAAKKAVKARKFRVPVRYRDDKGNTWTGRGNRPRWLVAAIGEGRKIEDFLIK